MRNSKKQELIGAIEAFWKAHNPKTAHWNCLYLNDMTYKELSEYAGNLF